MRLLGLQIHHLPARHTMGAACRGERSHQFAANEGIMVRCRIGENFKRQCMERIAGEDRCGFVKCLVHCRLAPAHVIIIHAGQVVMHQ